MTCRAALVQSLNPLYASSVKQRAPAEVLVRRDLPGWEGGCRDVQESGSLSAASLPLGAVGSIFLLRRQQETKGLASSDSSVLAVI